MCTGEPETMEHGKDVLGKSTIFVATFETAPLPGVPARDIGTVDYSNALSAALLSHTRRDDLVYADY